MQVFVIISNVGIIINADVNLKSWFKKVICDKIFICNPSNCEYEPDKSCDVGEYLYEFLYEYFKCIKMLVDKLVEECTNIYW